MCRKKIENATIHQNKAKNNFIGRFGGDAQKFCVCINIFYLLELKEVRKEVVIYVLQELSCSLVGWIW